MYFSQFKKISLSILAVASFFMVAGCTSLTDLKADLSESVFGREADEKPDALPEIKETKISKLLWQARVGTTGNFEFSPAYEAGFIYAASANGEVLKLDAISGKPLWRINVGEKLSGGVGVGGSLVIVGTQQGVVYTYNLDGKLQWKAKLSSEILSAPQYFDGLTIIRTGDNRIYGLSAEDGSRKWVYSRASPSLTLRSSAGVIVDGGAIYAGFGGGKLVSIRADNGQLLWEVSIAQPKGVTEIERIADIASLPVVEGPLVYAVAYQGTVAAIDRMNGRIIWNREISSLTGLTLQDGKIFISHTTGALYSLDYATGKTFWRQALLKNRQLTTPVAMNDALAVGDVEGYVHFLSRDDGALVSKIKLDSSSVLSIMAKINDSTVLAQTRNGGLYAVQIK